MFRNMNILHVKSMKLTHILCVRYNFWRSPSFYACLSVTVIRVKRRSQGCTLRFRPLSTRRWFAPRKSFRSAFFSTILYGLRSLHPQYQNSPRILLKTSIFYYHFQVRFALTTLWTSRLDTAAEETWIRGQFTLHLWTMVEIGVCSLDFVFWHE